MERTGRDNLVIGMMIVITYFLVYAILGQSPILHDMGGLPMIDCTSALIRNGFSGHVMVELTSDFAQTIIVVFVVVFIQNLLPRRERPTPYNRLLYIIGYIALYVISLYVVRRIVYTETMNDIIRVFVSIFSVVVAMLGAVISTPIRRLLASVNVRNYLINYLLGSRVIHWLADSFFISSVILFLCVAIEISVGLPYFFTTMIAGTPTIITMVTMLFFIYLLIKG